MSTLLVTRSPMMRALIAAHVSDLTTGTTTTSIPPGATIVLDAGELPLATQIAALVDINRQHTPLIALLREGNVGSARLLSGVPSCYALLTHTALLHHVTVLPVLLRHPPVQQGHAPLAFGVVPAVPPIRRLTPTVLGVLVALDGAPSYQEAAARASLSLDRLRNIISRELRPRFGLIAGERFLHPIDLFAAVIANLGTVSDTHEREVSGNEPVD